MSRANTRVVKIGDRVIGGGNPILIQSMTNTKTEDVAATVAQILTLEKAGCQIIRCAVPTMEAARALGEIKKQIHIPLVADIHFDYKLAIAAMERCPSAENCWQVPEEYRSRHRRESVYRSVLPVVEAMAVPLFGQIFCDPERKCMESGRFLR